jgi:DNA-binding response OmpR family regulator
MTTPNPNATPISPLVLVIDDSTTIRKMVECHLSQAGYRVELAPDAERGLAMASSLRPDLILLDHQLPGVTGNEVCRSLLANEDTARVPVLVSSALRHRAFAQYADFPNVVDQIPKPFTPELLKSGVANALQTGALVVQAQRTGCAMPESVEATADAALSGDCGKFPPRAVIDFLNNMQADGRLTLEVGKDRLRFALGAGRLQAVYSPTVAAERVADHIPVDLADLAPLLSVTMGETQDPSMSGLVKLLERSLSDPRRLRALLRCQAAALTYFALSGEAKTFAFEPRVAVPPMFQAFPLQLSLAALAVEGVRICVAQSERSGLGSAIFARQNARGGNVDRAGLSPADLRVHTLLDGAESVESVARKAGVAPAEAAAVGLGLALAGHAERRAATAGAAVLVVENDPEAAKVAVHALGPDGEGCQVRHVRDRVAAQLLMRRSAFNVVMLPLDGPDHEAFYMAVRQHAPTSTRIVGMLRIDDEGQLERLDALGLDGVVHRPLSEPELRATFRQLLREREPAGAA